MIWFIWINCASFPSVLWAFRSTIGKLSPLIFWFSPSLSSSFFRSLLVAGFLLLSFRAVDILRGVYLLGWAILRLFRQSLRSSFHWVLRKPKFNVELLGRIFFSSFRGVILLPSVLQVSKSPGFFSSFNYLNDFCGRRKLPSGGNHDQCFPYDEFCFEFLSVELFVSDFSR